jgi:RNA polymerase sigma-70 factor (ECF subfamily)
LAAGFLFPAFDNKISLTLMAKAHINKYKIFSIIIMISVASEREFIALYDEFFPKIYNFILRTVAFPEVAEDLTSNVFTSALKYIKTKDVEIKNFSAWMYKIATNEVLKYLNSKRKKATLSLDDERKQLGNYLVDERSDKTERFARYWTVKQALKKLKPEEAVIVEMHFFEDKKYDEMAGILNMKEATIRTRVHRILKKLEKIIAAGDRVNT